MAGDIETLRNQLERTIDGLLDGRVDVSKARAIAAVGQVQVNTARAEVEYLRLTKQTRGSRFMQLDAPAPGNS